MALNKQFHLYLNFNNVEFFPYRLKNCAFFNSLFPTRKYLKICLMSKRISQKDIISLILFNLFFMNHFPGFETEIFAFS